MADRIEERRNRRVRLRRERILEFVKQQYERLYEARQNFLQKYDRAAKEEREALWHEYTLLLNEGSMFRYGVAMADPDGKWMKKFNDVYEEVEREHNDTENS